jgi:hypothetical protein
VLDLEARVLEVLRRRRPHARFVAELTPLVAADASELELALASLEKHGRVLVRDQYCADPHMDGVDLRIAALGEGVEAIAAIDTIWQRWLGEYLANHRCT